MLEALSSQVAVPEQSAAAINLGRGRQMGPRRRNFNVLHLGNRGLNLCHAHLHAHRQQDQCAARFSAARRVGAGGLFLPSLKDKEQRSAARRGGPGFGTVDLMSFSRNILNSCAASALLGLGFVLPAAAQEDAPKEDKVVAIVNGHEIRVSEVQMATDDIIGQLPDLPPKLRYPFVVEYLIERHLLAQFAVKEGIADTEEYKRRLALYQAKALRDAYFFQKIRPLVTEEEMRKVYDEEVRQAPADGARARPPHPGRHRAGGQGHPGPPRQGREVRGSGQAVQPRRLEGIRRRSRLLHPARDGARILQGRLRPQGRRDLAAHQDRFRLAHHPPGRPASRAPPSPTTR